MKGCIIKSKGPWPECGRCIHRYGSVGCVNTVDTGNCPLCGTWGERCKQCKKIMDFVDTLTGEICSDCRGKNYERILKSTVHIEEED